MNLSERITHAVQESGLTQKEIAARVGVSPGAITQWKKGEIQELKASNLLALAKATGVNPEWLASGKGEIKGATASAGVVASLRPVAVWEHEHDLDQDEYIFLPALEVKLSAGEGSAVWHIDEKGQKQAFTRKWATRHCIDPDCAATYVVSGSSMEPRLLDGDSVVIDYCQNDTIIDGKVYAIAMEGEAYIKRLFKEFGGVRVVSDNPDKRAYPDRLVPAEKMEYLKIIGRVVAVCGGM